MCNGVRLCCVKVMLVMVLVWMAGGRSFGMEFVCDFDGALLG